MMNTEGRISSVQPAGIEDTSRRILNTNLEVLNRVDKEDSEKHIRDTLEEIIDIMIPHCGPRSRYATIITGTGNAEFEPSIFTKDGANILAYLEFVSPIKTYIKRFIEYIGRRVDNEAKDGTTTAILFTSTFLLNLIEARHGDTVTSIKELDALTTNEISQLFSRVNEKVIQNLQSYVMTVADLPGTSIQEKASLMAFMQAMSSSGGDTLLADCMRRIFLSSPREGWDRLTVTQSVLEGGAPFRVKYHEYDYRLYAGLDIDEVLNASLNTGYEVEDVTVLVYADTLSFGMSALDTVTDYLETTPDTPHLVLAKSFDARLITYVKKLNKERKHPIALFSSMEDDGGRRSLDMEALCHMTGTVSYADGCVGPISKEHTFTAKKAMFYGNYLELFHIFDRSPEDTLHPYMRDLDNHPKYRDFLNILQQITTSSKQGHVKNGKLVESVSRVYKQMTCIGVPELYVAGDTHTNLSNMSVQQDVQGATIASLSSGFLCAGLLAFCDALRKYTSDTMCLDTLERNIAKHMQHAIEDIIQVVYGSTMSDFYKQHETIDKEQYSNALFPTTMHVSEYAEHLYSIVREHRDGDALLKALREDTYITAQYPPCQPVMVYKELLSRTQELILRVLLMDKIIVPGGAYLEKE